MHVKLKIFNDLNLNTIILGIKKRTPEIDQIVTYIQNSPGETITAKSADSYQVIPLADCLSFHSAQKKVYVTTTAHRDLLINQRLYQLQKSLPSSFIRISNTEIINLNHVRAFDVSKGGIILIYFTDGSQTSSSRRYLKTVRERLS